ncbi:MAG: tetratricopeptide repeat protein, partial [Bacteroidales bacterium]|nr:tetratricopeptide repeat protein [Bacteroidales bacterium]
NTRDFNDAKKYYNSLLSKREDENAYFNMGYINLVYLEDYPKAISFFQKALNINEDYNDALFNLAYSLELSGDLKDARTKYKELLKKVPNHEGAIARLNGMPL